MTYCKSFILINIITYTILILPILFIDILEFHPKLGVENRSTRAYHLIANGLVEAQNKILKRLVLLVNYLITNL